MSQVRCVLQVEARRCVLACVLPLLCGAELVVVVISSRTSGLSASSMRDASGVGCPGERKAEPSQAAGGYGAFMGRLGSRKGGGMVRSSYEEEQVVLQLQAVERMKNMCKARTQAQGVGLLFPAHANDRLYCCTRLSMHKIFLQSLGPL